MKVSKILLFTSPGIYMFIHIKQRKATKKCCRYYVIACGGPGDCHARVAAGVGDGGRGRQQPVGGHRGHRGLAAPRVRGPEPERQRRWRPGPLEAGRAGGADQVHLEGGLEVRARLPAGGWLPGHLLSHPELLLL